MARTRYQQGSVVLLPSGWWVLRWREDVVEADGSIRRVARKTRLGTREELPTEKLAKRAAEPVLAKVNARGYRPGRFATLERFATDWERDALAMLKPGTQRVHHSYLQGHILPALGKLRLDELDQQRLQGFVACLSRAVKPKTVANVVGVLGALLKSAREWGYAIGPACTADLVMPRSDVRAARPCFTVDEVRAILQGARFPDLAACALLAYTGARGGEVFALNWQDVDFQTGTLLVLRGNYRGTIQTTKSTASNRALPIPQPLAEILKAYREQWPPNLAGHLFAEVDGRPVNPEAWRRWRFKPMLKRLGITKPAGFHAFRHAQASMLVSTGANPKVAQAQLGHSDIRVTLGLYAHVVGDDHRAAVEKVAEILCPVVSRVPAKLLRVK